MSKKLVKCRSGQPWGCTVPAGPQTQSQGCVLVCRALSLWGGDTALLTPQNKWWMGQRSARVGEESLVQGVAARSEMLSACLMLCAQLCYSRCRQLSLLLSPLPNIPLWLFCEAGH